MGILKLMILTQHLVSRGSTAIGRGLLWLMQRSKTKTKDMKEQDGAEGRRTQDKNANQTQVF